MIGFATRPIAPGDHVHTHNLAVGEMQLDYQFGVDMRILSPLVPPEQRRTFQGYRRADGSVGTRNTLVLITTVNCSAHTVRQIAARARAELLPRFPNVTDIVALAHRAGCASAASGPEIEMLRRTLAGFARNPNVAGYLFVGLGCETNQFEALFESQRARLGRSAPAALYRHPGFRRRRFSDRGRFAGAGCAIAARQRSSNAKACRSVS